MRGDIVVIEDGEVVGRFNPKFKLGTMIRVDVEFDEVGLSYVFTPARDPDLTYLFASTGRIQVHRKGHTLLLPYVWRPE